MGLVRTSWVTLDKTLNLFKARVVEWSEEDFNMLVAEAKVRTRS